jgi:1,4-dihydroxy-2-naphthoate octaprenyltransferase
VLVGTGAAAYADGAVWWKAALALLVSLALQVGVNYANDYSDGVRGTDDERVGPLRLTGAGLATPASVKAAAFAAFGVGAVAGLALAATSAWWLLVVGAVCIVAAWYYTGGSKPYGYAGLGEVAVFVFFGLVAVNGTEFVQTGSFSWVGLAGSVAIGALACSLLVVNNLRDIPGDTVVGKVTLAVRLGDTNTRRFFALLVTLPVAGTIAVAVITKDWWTLASLGYAAPAMKAARTVGGDTHGPALIPALGQTSMAELVWALGVGVPLILR